METGHGLEGSKARSGPRTPNRVTELGLRSDIVDKARRSDRGEDGDAAGSWARSRWHSSGSASWMMASGWSSAQRRGQDDGPVSWFGSAVTAPERGLSEAGRRREEVRPLLTMLCSPSRWKKAHVSVWGSLHSFPRRSRRRGSEQRHGSGVATRLGLRWRRRGRGCDHHGGADAVTIATSWRGRHPGARGAETEASWSARRWRCRRGNAPGCRTRSEGATRVVGVRLVSQPRRLAKDHDVGVAGASVGKGALRGRGHD